MKNFICKAVQFITLGKVCLRWCNRKGEFCKIQK